MTSPNTHTDFPVGSLYSLPPIAPPLPARLSSTRHHSCPRCDGHVIRAWRRPIDRFMCNFVPMHRYRCEDFSCQWEGNLRTTKSRSGHGADTPPLKTVFGIILAAVVFSIAAIAWFSWEGRELAFQGIHTPHGQAQVSTDTLVAQTSVHRQRS